MAETKTKNAGKAGNKSAKKAGKKASSKKTTWRADAEHGPLSTAEPNDLPDSVFAFPNCARSR